MTASYKLQYRLAITSTVGNTFGDNFHDSGLAISVRGALTEHTFNGNSYTFRGWTGSGTGSYTSPDTTGNDTVAICYSNPVVEVARWTPIGIQNLSTEITERIQILSELPESFQPANQYPL